MTGPGIQGEGLDPNRPVKQQFEESLGENVEIGGQKFQLIVNPKVIEQNDEIIKLLKTMIFHLEMITGQEGVQIG